MKKFAIIAVVFVLGLATLIGWSITRAAERNALARAVSDHMIHCAQNLDQMPEAQHGEQETLLVYDNSMAFLRAVDRTMASFRLLPPSVEGMDSVTVFFGDGAEISVFNAGHDSEGDDVAHIRHCWRGDTDWFTLTGFKTFERVSECVSLDGFGIPNSPAK